MKPEIDPSNVREKLDHGSFLLDVREPDEWAEAHVAGATLIPLGELERRIAEVPRDRDIICMCRSGKRSAKAQTLLLRHLPGAQVANMRGGLLGWLERKLPVERRT